MATLGWLLFTILTTLGNLAWSSFWWLVVPAARMLIGGAQQAALAALQGINYIAGAIISIADGIGLLRAPGFVAGLFWEGIILAGPWFLIAFTLKYMIRLTMRGLGINPNFEEVELVEQEIVAEGIEFDERVFDGVFDNPYLQSENPADVVRLRDSLVNDLRQQFFRSPTLEEENQLRLLNEAIQQQEGKRLQQIQQDIREELKARRRC